MIALGDLFDGGVSLAQQAFHVFFEKEAIHKLAQNTMLYRIVELVNHDRAILNWFKMMFMLHMALAKGATEIITGSFLNLSAVCDHLASIRKNVILGCAAWKDKPNMEDTLFAGAVISRVKEHFSINCDASHIAENLYRAAHPDLFEFMKHNEASHYHRLMNFGLEKDIRHCLIPDMANVLPEYVNGKLVIQKADPI